MRDEYMCILTNSLEDVRYPKGCPYFKKFSRGCHATYSHDGKCSVLRDDEKESRVFFEGAASIGLQRMLRKVSVSK